MLRGIVLFLSLIGLLSFSIPQAYAIESLVVGQALSNRVEEANKASSQTQPLDIEKLTDFLNLIDDEKKRELFIKDVKQKISSTTFTVNTLKYLFFYLLKLLCLCGIYYLVKKGGVRLLDYQIEKVERRRKKIIQHNIKASENLLILETLGTLFKSIFLWILRLVFTLIFLSVIGFDVSSFFYSFGFFALAISLASKNIIQDFINGILVIMNGSIAVGEVVDVAGYRGTIESITLRSVSLRTSTGELIIVPFSNINDVKNYSRTYARIVCEVIVMPQQDLKKVEEAFQKAYHQMKTLYPQDVKDDLYFAGILKMSEYGSHVVASFMTTPDPRRVKHYKFNTFVHEACRELGIQRSVYNPL